MGYVKLMKASAGSGKTYQLAYEYIRAVIAEPYDYRHILAVTFTNKATEEMKRRIIREIDRLATQNGESDYLSRLCTELSMTPETVVARAKRARTLILHDYSHFAVLTIDKFFQRIIRSFIKELSLDMDFTLELRTDTLLSNAADSLIEDISSDESLKKWITAYVEERIDENKKWDIRSGLIELGSEIFKESFNRTGGELISREDMAALCGTIFGAAAKAKQHIKAVAREFISMLSDHSLSAGDFPYGLSGVGGYIFKLSQGELKAPGKRVSDALYSEKGWLPKAGAREKIEPLVPELTRGLERICAAYSDNINLINSANMIRDNYRNFGLLAELSEKISLICSREGIMPIAETNRILGKLIAGNDTPFIFEKAGNYFSRFMIDEFQDTSRMQWENFLPLLKNALSQGSDEPVLVVGDVKQSIYRWRGGDWRILAQDVQQKFPDTRTVELQTNYRSSENVIRFNNELIRACVEADNSALNAEIEQAVVSRRMEAGLADRLRDMLSDAYAGHEQKSSGRQGGFVDVTVWASTGDEERVMPPVIERIEELQSRGYRAGDIAVLVRYNAEGAAIADMLLEHKRLNPASGYCYDVVTQEALTIGSSDAVAFVISCFCLAIDPENSIHRAIYNRWLGRQMDHMPDDAEKDFLLKIALMPLQEGFEAINQRFDITSSGRHTAYIQAFHEQLISFSNTSVSDIGLFLQWWKDNGSKRSVNVPPSDSAINIITIHKSKGLQYPAVIIPYCNWPLGPRTRRTLLWAGNKEAKEDKDPVSALGTVPVFYSSRMKESHFSADYCAETVMSHVDNINTVYVAVTRAMEELHIMIPETGRPTANVGSLIKESISVVDGSALLGPLKGRCLENPPFTSYRFGTEGFRKRPPVVDGSIVLPGYRSYPVEGRLRVKRPASRHIDAEGRLPDLTPRDRGVLLHNVFENATDRVQIGQNIVKLSQNGLIDPAQTTEMIDLVNKAFEHPMVGEWFSGKWEEVKTESTIILPGEYSTRRPDRVMIADGRAVVVDYKFGLERKSSYGSQVRSYASLLESMGYRDVKGYVWYVSLGDVEQVI